MAYSSAWLTLEACSYLVMKKKNGENHDFIVSLVTRWYLSNIVHGFTTSLIQQGLGSFYTIQGWCNHLGSISRDQSPSRTQILPNQWAKATSPKNLNRGRCLGLYYRSFLLEYSMVGSPLGAMVCRNMLIYFVDDNRNRIQGMGDQILGERGLRKNHEATRQQGKAMRLVYV